MSENLFDDFVTIVDRSDLEMMAACPMQARLKRDSRKVVGIAASIGEGDHVAISQAVQHYIDSVDGGEVLRVSDIADRITLNLQHSRPDIQPAAIEACKPAIWSIARTLHATDPDNIIRFDGGKESRSGQLAYDPIPGFRVTAELDLLRATESKEVMREDDWKSGRGMWTTADVAESFQFTLHAVLVFANYSGVTQLDVVIWNLRQGYPLPAVQFYRRKFDEYSARVMTTVNAWLAHDTAPIEKVPCWAATEKCRICDVSAKCPAAEREFSADPVDLLRQRIATAAKVDALDKLLQAAVTRDGKPVETPEGDVYGKFGAAKPTMAWKVKSVGKGGNDE